MYELSVLCQLGKAWEPMIAGLTMRERRRSSGQEGQQRLVERDRTECVGRLACGGVGGGRAPEVIAR